MPSRAGGPGVGDASWRRAHSHTQGPSPASLAPTLGGVHLPGREGATRNRKMPPKLWHRGAGHGSWTKWENKKEIGEEGPSGPKAPGHVPRDQQTEASCQHLRETLPRARCHGRLP